MNFLRTHRLYVVVYVVLMLALAVTAAIAPVVPGQLGLAVHLLLAFFMIMLIGAWFIGVRYYDPLLQVVALGVVLFLLFMWVIMPVDYFTR